MCATHQHMILSRPGTPRKPRLLGVLEVAMVQNSKEGKAATVATLLPGTFGTSTSHKMQIASLLHPGPLQRPPQRYLPATWDLCPRLGGPYHVHCYFCEVTPHDIPIHNYFYLRECLHYIGFEDCTVISNDHESKESRFFFNHF